MVPCHGAGSGVADGKRVLRHRELRRPGEVGVVDGDDRRRAAGHQERARTAGKSPDALPDAGRPAGGNAFRTAFAVLEDPDEGNAEDESQDTEQEEDVAPAAPEQEIEYADERAGDEQPDVQHALMHGQGDRSRLAMVLRKERQGGRHVARLAHAGGDGTEKHHADKAADQSRHNREQAPADQGERHDPFAAEPIPECPRERSNECQCGKERSVDRADLDIGQAQIVLYGHRQKAKQSTVGLIEEKGRREDGQKPPFVVFAHLPG